MGSGKGGKKAKAKKKAKTKKPVGRDLSSVTTGFALDNNNNKYVDAQLNSCVPQGEAGYLFFQKISSKPKKKC